MSTSQNGRKRSSYLLDGRRVTVADLVEAGLLAAGDRLRFDRPRVGETHYAKVSDRGGLVLEGGQEIFSPSRAASVAADIGAVPGWYAWQVESTRRSLDSLRRELLDQAATRSDVDTDGDEGAVAAAQHRHDRLKEARRLADAGTPMEISVCDLLSWWGVKVRGHGIDQRIEADLVNHGLVTSPSFQAVTLDAVVHLISVPQEVDSFEATAVEADDVDEFEVGLTVGNLPSALGGVESVAPDATVDEVITVMLLNDYSQLAVLPTPRNLRGAITWRSIAQARHANPSARLAGAIVQPEVVPYDRELIDVLPILKTSDFVFVRNDKNEVSGIVTTADVVQAYGELATPFFLIGEVDQLLRRLISQTFTLADVTSLCDPRRARSVRSFDDLAMGDYQRVLENPDRWVQLGWPLNRAIFIKRLDEIREVRNDVMHFNRDGVLPGTVDKLRNFLKLLREYGE